MRTDEERILKIHSRAKELKEENQRKQSLLITGASALGCIALIIIISLSAASVSDFSVAEAGAQGMRASMLSGNSALKFVVVGILAFMLGCSFTIFCMKFKNKQDNEEKGE